MNLRRVSAIALRQFYLMRGSFSRVLPLFVWVAIDMVLWGYISRYFQGMMMAQYQGLGMLLGAVLLWDFFIRVMQGVTMAFFEDVWSKNFLNIFASPISIGEYLTGLVFCSIVSSAVGLAVMWAVASGVFGMKMAIYGAYAVPFLLVMFIFGVSLGIVSCAMVLRFGPAAEWFIWPIPAILSPFIGVFYPLSVLPVWMQRIGAILPPSYVFEQVRHLIQGQPVSLHALGMAWFLALVGLGLSFIVFVRVYKEATRIGLIARYSSESVG